MYERMREFFCRVVSLPALVASKMGCVSSGLEACAANEAHIRRCVPYERFSAAFIALFFVLTLGQAFAASEKIIMPEETVADATMRAEPMTADVFLSHVKVAPGQKIQVAFRLTFDPEWHVNAHELDSPDLVPTTISLENNNDFKVKTASWPDGEIYAFPFDPENPLLVYSGEVWVLMDLIASEQARAGASELRFKIECQACKDMCLPPEIAEIIAPLKIESGTAGLAAARNEKLFALLDKRLGGKKREVSAIASVSANSFEKPMPGESGKSVSPNESSSLWLHLLYGLLGGIILNVMPCVLPIISIKLFGLVAQAKENRAVIRRHGLLYGLGVLFSMLSLALFVVILRVFAEDVGWGVQFQNPYFVFSMVVLVFVCGLSMLGVFEFPMLNFNAVARATAQPTLAGSFLGGVFTVLLATPCTGPFLGTAVGYALSLSAPIIFAMFAAVAFGLALPFLAVSFAPGWARLLPKPGNWMVVFKELMGFLMLGAVVWFLSALLAQIRPERFIGALLFLLLLGVACWAYGKWASPIASAFSRNLTVVASLIVLVPAAYWFLDFSADESGGVGGVAGGTERDVIENEEIIWRTFSWEFVQAESEAGRPVFVDATAAWCATCKVNERLVIRTPEIASLFKRLNYTVVKADFTRRNPEVWRWLTAHGKAGVPLYVIIPPRRFSERDVLPELLPGKDFLAERLKRGAGRMKTDD